MFSRLALFAAVAFGPMLYIAPSRAVAQRPPADIELPPITWACPMNGTLMPDGTIHADVYEDAKGNCPICKMALTAVRLDSIWTCPVHSVIAEKGPGKCPIDHRDLVRVTVAMSWTCAGHPEIDQLTPGQCPDGSAMSVKYTPRPHGNHNPQHGGQFFMAADNWHHLEGAYPQAGVVRIYLYDDYTKPLPDDQVKLVRGRIVTKESLDPVTHIRKEVAFPLVLSRDRRYLEARVDTRRLPAPMAAKITFKPEGPENRFDFTFPEFSKDPGAAPTLAKAAAAKAASPATARAQAPTATVPQSATPVVNVNPPAAAAPAFTQSLPIPASIEEMVAELSMANRQIQDLINRGAFTDIWVSAFRAKDLALAMDARSAQLPTYKRRILEPAIKRLLRAAWLLDAVGDIGNRDQITGAYADFGAAVSEIEALFQPAR
jgi:hypothetical protein